MPDGSMVSGPDLQIEVEVPEEEMSVDEASKPVELWVNEVRDAGGVEEDEEGMQIQQEALDDVHGGNYL